MFDDGTDPGESGGSGGGSGGSSGGDESITGMITPEECDEPLTGDLDGDCMLSPYELCLLNGYSQEVCECVEAGNDISECEEDRRKKRCQKLKDIVANGNFSERMSELRTATADSTEILYYGKANSVSEMNYSSEDRLEGASYIHGIPNHTINNPVDSQMHNHFMGGLSVFSSNDLYALYILYTTNKIADIRTFVMFVTTPGNNLYSTSDDTIYALFISDETKFQINGQNLLSTENMANFIYLQKKIIPNVSAALNEQRLAELVKEKDIGLSIYKGNISDFTDWSEIKVDSNSVLQYINCN